MELEYSKLKNNISLVVIWSFLYEGIMLNGTLLVNKTGFLKIKLDVAS